MNLEQELQALGESAIEIDERHLQMTIHCAQAALYVQNEAQTMRYGEFLLGQLRYTRKRWWALQGLLLAAAAYLLPGMSDEMYQVRTIGVFGCLFVIFMIPELWRNRSTDATQVEASCLYALRQIYAARITLFGGADTLFLSLFCWTVHHSMGLSITALLSQLLLPVTVTACICFGMLCRRRQTSEAAALSASLIWCAVWWCILMNERFYRLLFSGLWAALLGLALLLLMYTVQKTIQHSQFDQEVEAYELTTG